MDELENNNLEHDENVRGVEGANTALSVESKAVKNVFKNIKNSHPKVTQCIQIMITDLVYKLPFYGHLMLNCNQHERDSIPTCAVNFSTKGMNFYWNRDFFDKISQKEANFTIVHELFHIIFNHPKRGISGRFDKKLANIAQDWIINNLIMRDMSPNFVEIPKDDKQRHRAIFITKEIENDTPIVFEIMYVKIRDLYENYKTRVEILRQQNLAEEERKRIEIAEARAEGGAELDPMQFLANVNNDGVEEGNIGNIDMVNQALNLAEMQQEQDQVNTLAAGFEQYGAMNAGTSSDDIDIFGKPKYGKYGRNDEETFSLDAIFEDMHLNNGQFLDSHMEDDISPELREQMVRDQVDTLRARGLVAGNIETTLRDLRKKKKDHLKEIKRKCDNIVFGRIKKKTISRASRRQIEGLKGYKKYRTEINVLLDTSGSMSGDFEKVLNYIYQNDITINMVQCDTEVKATSKYSSKTKLNTMKIRGLGGTTLQPAVDYIVEHYNKYNTVVLTDGGTDRLDFSRHKGKVLVISSYSEVPLTDASRRKVKQIILDRNG